MSDAAGLPQANASEEPGHVVDDADSPGPMSLEEPGVAAYQVENAALERRAKDDRSASIPT